MTTGLALLSNDYCIVQYKGWHHPVFFFYLNKGFVIKSNELSINSISKTVAILMLNCISKGHYSHNNSLFFALAFIQRIFWPNVAPLAIKSWIAIFHWQKISYRFTVLFGVILFSNIFYFLLYDLQGML
jgi:hypothetical protein